ncbi:hypothetical protein HYC85_008022 [Camellia sinensis]|uniref:Uncharacterized protein n=1 Tax=Camellia sinensis TaxID=4442 RepID=A0A7J7HSZ8_CAMSI|nr:hypothetical protein HYC85_008022 [Camellia sinensis]
MDQALHLPVLLLHLSLRLLSPLHYRRSFHHRLSLYLQALLFLFHYHRHFLHFSATLHHLHMGFSNHNHL